jgi:putative ABC transport system permease protein
MSVIWRKVWLDLWQNKVRTLLAVLSIAAGVFAIGATFGMADQMLSGMDAAHQATYPAHIQLFTAGIDRDIVSRFKKIEGVEDIDLANFRNIRYKISPEQEWETGWLVMRDDYDAQKYDRYQLKDGRWPEDKGLAIERLSSQHYDIQISDSVIFDIDNREQLFSIVGKMRHPFVEPPQFGGPAVFFTDAEGLERVGIPEGEFNQLLIRVSPYSDEFARDIASDIKDRLAKDGIGVGIINYQDPQKHWGRSIMEGINLVLQTMAMVSLGVSVILVLNTLTALITQQTYQIGIMKAIGAKTGTIIKIYLVGVIVYGLLALLFSLPLGAWIAFAITQWFLNIFNIDYNQFQVSERAILFQTLAALLVPILSALWPILNGATITVREALASYGLGNDFGASRFDRLVERLSPSFMSAPYVMTIRNMFRRRGRFILTQLVLIIAGTMFLVVMSLSSSINFTLDNDFARRHYDVQMLFEESERVDRVVRVADAHPGVAEAEVWYIRSASILKEGQRTREAGFGAEIVGIPAGSQMFRPLLVAGRWLQPEDERALVISIDSAEDNNISVGEAITLDIGELGDSDWQVVGLFNDPFGGGVGTTDPIYANQEAVFRAIKRNNRGNRVYIRMKEQHKSYVEALSSQLKELFKDNNMEIAESENLHEIRESAENQFSIVILMLLGLALIMAVVGGIGLMGSLSISVVERTKEIGVMRAIGARTNTMMGMFILEGIMQGLLSWLIVVPFSTILGQSMAKSLGETMLDVTLDYQYNLEAIFIWLLIILTISTLASVLPARHASSISVRESLAYA